MTRFYTDAPEPQFANAQLLVAKVTLVTTTAR